MLKTFLQENQFILPSYQHYGGYSGFQDYGILGFKLKNNLLEIWKKTMLDSDIHEVEIPSIMPYAVLKASGHVERFMDYVVYDENGLCYRADHLAKKWFKDHDLNDLANLVDSWDSLTLEHNINKYAMFEVPIVVLTKNLMIEVPSNTLQSSETDYLRPELAQGIFVNFKTYYTYFQHDESDFKPFGIAQIGKSYRKEISPQPFVRMREFTQAEIEYFFDPKNISCQNFDSYRDLIVVLLTDENQTLNVKPVKISLGHAVDNGLINHKLMAYFLAKIYIFAKRIGLHDDKIRFRQHQRNEMAHYANQCWDLECFVGGSWLECVGCADRGCYDLTAHSKINPKQPFMAKRKLSMPIKNTNIIIKPLLQKMNHIDPKNFSVVKEYFVTLTDTDILSHIINKEIFTIEIAGISYSFTPEMFNLKENITNINYETFVPHVLEPSFGIDRLIYAVLEQNIWKREFDDRRLVLSLPNDLILYDVAVFPLHKKDEMCKLADKIRSELIMVGFKCYIDDSGTAIGKKYVRCDEIGVRYAITIDPGSLKSGLVTVRNRDTINQSYVHYNDLVATLKNQS
jgi:glycyl-tRNA synthetase